MASGKYGVKTREWWKHLRWTKRYFWKAHRVRDKELSRDVDKVVERSNN